jgi:hypothetical protein
MQKGSNSVIKVASTGGLHASSSGLHASSGAININEITKDRNPQHNSNNISVYSASASTTNQSMGRMFRSLSQNENKANITISNQNIKSYQSNHKFSPAIPSLDLTKVNPNFSKKQT